LSYKIRIAEHICLLQELMSQLWNTVSYGEKSCDYRI